MTLCAQDHNYTAPLPCTPPLSPLAPPSPTKLSGGTAGLGGGLPLDDTGSTATAAAAGIREVVVTTTTGDPAVVDDSVTRCICDFQHDDGYMICCDQCGSVTPYIHLYYLPHPRQAACVIVLIVSVCMYACQMITFESLDVGSSYLHMWCISTIYGSSSYMKLKVKVTGTKKIDNSYSCNAKL